MYQPIPNTTLSLSVDYSWFPVLITGSNGTGNAARYSWVQRRAEGNGNIGNAPGVPSGNATGNFAGVSVSGASFTNGDYALARPAPGAGGYLFELMPANSTGGGNGNGGGNTIGASAGWGWIAGLETSIHCLKANITAGNASGRSANITNQTRYMAYNGTSGTWQTGGNGANATFDCANAKLDFTVTSGEPKLSLIGGNGCNNQTMNGYQFRFNGQNVGAIGTDPTDTLHWRGGGNSLANATVLSNISNNSKPTAYLNTFGVELSLCTCARVTCCSNNPMPTTLFATFTGNATYNGNYTLSFYNAEASGTYDNTWVCVINFGANEQLLCFRCSPNVPPWAVSVQGDWTAGSLEPQIASGNLSAYILSTGSATFYSCSANETTCSPLLIEFQCVNGNVTVTE